MAYPQDWRQWRREEQREHIWRERWRHERQRERWWRWTHQDW